MALKLWIKGGSREDPHGKKGIHQILGSTICRGCGPYNNHQIAEIVESSGSILSCETYEDGLLISLKCINNDAFKLIPIIGWMITKPLLEADQIELEKNLTINAIKRQKESSYQQAFDGWRKMIFNEGPYGHDSLGTISNLNSIKKKHIIPLANSLIKRKKKLVISGSLPNNIDEYLNTSKAFKVDKENVIQDINSNQKNASNELLIKQKTNICTHYLNTEQVVFLLGKATISYKNQSDILLRLISCYLGCGMSSFLFKVLREKHGVVYETGVYHPIREYKTPFIMHASTTENKALFTIKLLQQCWEEIINNEIPTEELNLAKIKYKGQMAHSLQSISQRAERKAHLLGLGLESNHDEKILMRLESISSKEIQNAAKLYLKDPSLSICGKEGIVNQIKNEWNK
tara:strand:+ start:4023 stop:5231 length:1209 start_codon:yes stop_codon:yes gene_type:complete